MKNTTTNTEIKTNNIETKTDNTETKTDNTKTKTDNTETKTDNTETTTSNTEVNATDKQSAKIQSSQEQITNGYDKIITFMEDKMEAAFDEVKPEYAEIIEELEADKQEMLEGLIVGSPQYIKDELFMHMFSISAGVVMAGIGTFLLIRARKVFGRSKAKIAGWILAGLGVGVIGLHIVQLVI